MFSFSFVLILHSTIRKFSLIQSRKIPKRTVIKSSSDGSKKRILETKNPKKETKTNQPRSNHDIGILKMSNLVQYDVPAQFHAIEMKADTSYLDVIETNCKLSATGPENYKCAQQALLYLNEAAELITLQGYNQKHIRISSSTGHSFEIQISVSNSPSKTLLFDIFYDF